MIRRGLYRFVLLPLGKRLRKRDRSNPGPGLELFFLRLQPSSFDMVLPLLEVGRRVDCVSDDWEKLNHRSLSQLLWPLLGARYNLQQQLFNRLHVQVWYPIGIVLFRELGLRLNWLRYPARWYRSICYWQGVNEGLYLRGDLLFPPTSSPLKALSMEKLRQLYMNSRKRSQRWKTHAGQESLKGSPKWWIHPG